MKSNDLVVGSELTVALTVTNTDSRPFEIGTALHTYFNISDIENIVLLILAVLLVVVQVLLVVLIVMEVGGD